VLPAAGAEAISIVLLVLVVGFALTRPRGLPEAAAAVPAALLIVALGLTGTDAATQEIRRLAPTVGFLAAVLVLAHLCDEEGLFTATGAAIAGLSRGQPARLLGLVFAVASVVTAVLSLDATVVLLTPVVLVTVERLRLRPKPHVYACAHLANSASLLLPVSNLTNLLAFAVCGLSFGRFAALMALPWVVVIAVEYVMFRRFFTGDLAISAARTDDPVAARPARGTEVAVPRFAIAVVALSLLGFAVSSLVGVAPAFVAAAGALALAVKRRAPIRRVVAAANVGFLLFVFALAVVVRAVVDNGLGHAVDRLLPGSTALPSLVAVALVAAVLANLVNNLPATLIVLAAIGPGHAGLVLAALIGVNVGPNLTYTGSLATLLWRRVLQVRQAEPELGEFIRLGALTVPAGLVAGVAALWLALQVVGV